VLFDIVNDPSESSELFEQEREIGNMLANEHQEWSRNLPPPLWPSMIYYVFKDGQKEYYFDQ
jgi:hypothetical protein